METILVSVSLAVGLHNKNCSEDIAGFWEQIGLWYIPLGILLLGLFIVFFVLLMIGVFCKRACTYELTRRRHEKKAAETVLLLVFLLLFGTLTGIKSILWFHQEMAGLCPIDGKLTCCYHSSNRAGASYFRGFTKFTQLHVVTSQFVMFIPCALRARIEDGTGSRHVNWTRRSSV